ncbi:MAG TPA: PSD1 and planctomycete cytochrome C domain-containing protein [Planctomycetaceae bacterium]|nr:PSD1 and planctomycete cytochrome C domain-containing protein [Planctomycetaceae bacterium]
MPIRLLPSVLCILMVFATAWADEAPPRSGGEIARPVDYLREVKPLLARRCTSCHGALRQKSGLRVDAASLILTGGDSGPAVVPGQPGESLLIDAVRGRGGFPLMPKEGGALAEDEIALLERWIADGAPVPANEPVAADPREHWAFRAPRRPDVSLPQDAPWLRNPVDAFVAAEHQRHGLVPAPEASRHVLLRRLFLDLIGLPPTPDELAEFLADPSPAAYEKAVDRLLASPHYGERWGRHWMDIWRYSDWYGYGNELRNSARHIWRWRDWIIESLNAERPYDRMVVEMLAADELAPTDRDALRATGYLARSYFKFNRDTWLDDTIEHTGKAFLGLTINCARCHDHMYDPLSQREYYQFRAIFEPHQVRTDRAPGEADVAKDGLPRIYDAHLAAQTFLFERGNDKRPDKEHPLGPAVPEAVAADAEFRVEPVSLPVAAWYPGFEPFVQDETLAAARIAVSASQAELEKSRAAREAAQDRDPDAETAVSVAERSFAAARAGLTAVEARIAADRARFADPPDARAEHLARTAAQLDRDAARLQAEADAAAAELELARAERRTQKDGSPDAKAAAAAKSKLEAARKRLDEVRTILEKPADGYKPLSETYPQTSSGRRLALARWIVDERNPLTARVAVNHIWLRHYGAPLVASVFDFGRNGQPPTHPALLDWLAVELVEGQGSRDKGRTGLTLNAQRSTLNWSMKRLHRLLVTSAAYRMASSVPDDHPGWALDRDNRWLWRMHTRRMEAELVRDSVLAVAGHLDRRMHGPDIGENEAQTLPRRSVYFRHAPEKHALFLTMFDSASTHECYRRVETVVPQQALAMANSRLVREQSRRLAGQLSAAVTASGRDAAAADVEFIGAAFERILCRPPAPAEADACLEFLSEQSARLSETAVLTALAAGGDVTVAPADAPRDRARESLIHVLLNHNEFVTIR